MPPIYCYHFYVLYFDEFLVGHVKDGKEFLYLVLTSAK
jgi:hypothetical protein